MLEGFGIAIVLILVHTFTCLVNMELPQSLTEAFSRGWILMRLRPLAVVLHRHLIQTWQVEARLGMIRRFRRGKRNGSYTIILIV